MEKETKLTDETANNAKANVSGSLPDGWKDFEAGFLAARDFYNKERATKNHKWILLPDKKIANAFWKYKEGNDR